MQPLYCDRHLQTKDHVRLPDHNIRRLCCSHHGVRKKVRVDEAHRYCWAEAPVFHDKFLQLHLFCFAGVVLSLAKFGWQYEWGLAALRFDGLAAGVLAV